MTWEVLKEDCLEGDYGEARGAEKLGISVEELRNKIKQFQTAVEA